MHNALGIDIGGTQMKAALVDSSGRILSAAKARTPLAPDAMRAELKALLAPLLDAGAARGVGVGCKGIIDPATTRIVRQPGVLRYLEGYVLSDLVTEAIGLQVPVYADNDARVMLAGECAWGAARGLRNALLFTLGTGVGGGILADGRIVRGHAGIAGHLGHVTADADGAPCICGNHGCLETVFSARAVEAAGWSAIHRGLVDAFPGAGAPPTCAEIFGAAERGNETALWIVRNGVRRLGAAIAGLVHALDPEAVIVGGQVASAGETLFGPLREEVWWRTRQLLGRDVPVIPTGMADPSGVIGAAALVFEADAGATPSRGGAE